MKKIGLCLIVKDEAHVIERCLNSVKDFIDYVYIADTGSSDDTINVIKRWLSTNNIKGKVVSHIWRNFAYNRTAVLQQLTAEKIVDYILMIDADEVLEFSEDPNEIKKNLHADLYDIVTMFDTLSYTRTQLTSTKFDFKYKGVVHEFLEIHKDATGRETLKGVINKPIQDSARNKSNNKTVKDAELLLNALTTEKDPFLNRRYTFYLAQSYRDCNELRKALIFYERRTKLQGWDQEIYASYIEAGKLKEKLGYFDQDVLASYYSALELIPERLDAIYYILKYCRSKNKFQQGHAVGQLGLNLKFKDSFLFANPSIYSFDFLDEYAINAYHAKQLKASRDAYNQLLAQGNIPPKELERTIKNAKYMEDLLCKIQS